MPNPRIRSVKPTYWDNRKVCKLSRDARLLYIGLQNFADDLGVTQSDSRWLKSKVFPLDHIQIRQFEGWIAELEESGFISHLSYNDDDFYYLPHFNDTQKVNRPSNRYYIPEGVLEKLIKELNARAESTPNAFNEPTVNNHCRKGKEGKGRERKGGEAPPPASFEKEDITSLTREQEIYSRFQEWLKESAPRLLKMTQPFSESELTRLLEEYPADVIKQYCINMHNYKPLLSNNVSANLTVRRWIKSDQKNDQQSNANKIGTLNY